MSTPRSWSVPGYLTPLGRELGPVLAVTFGLILAAIGTGSVLAETTAQNDKTCQPFDQGIEMVVSYASANGDKLVVVPHENMQAFLAGLGDEGKGILGDSAVVLMGPEQQVALFIKHGNVICLEATSGSHPAGDQQHHGTDLM